MWDGRPRLSESGIVQLSSGRTNQLVFATADLKSDARLRLPDHPCRNCRLVLSVRSRSQGHRPGNYCQSPLTMGDASAIRCILAFVARPLLDTLIDALANCARSGIICRRCLTLVDFIPRPV